jgi:hypothetical protein
MYILHRTDVCIGEGTMETRKIIVKVKCKELPGGKTTCSRYWHQKIGLGRIWQMADNEMTLRSSHMSRSYIYLATLYEDDMLFWFLDFLDVLWIGTSNLEVITVKCALLSSGRILIHSQERVTIWMVLWFDRMLSFGLYWPDVIVTEFWTGRMLSFGFMKVMGWCYYL